MSAQHLPRDAVRPSSDYEELSQKKNHGYVTSTREIFVGQFVPINSRANFVAMKS